ncbi:MAG: GUN4 domain-containing protein [Actinomycetota bacterium]
MTTEPPNLQQLAKQGNPKAIATLLNRSFQPKGITVKAAVKNGCLQLMLEATQIPPKQPYVDSLRKGLTILMPTAIQKVRVYGKQVGEDVPEWLEEFELFVQPIQDLSELARQGDVKAINTLLNQWLQSHGVVAKVRLKNDSLQVMLESTEIPEQQIIVELLNAEVSKLKIVSVKTMKLFGKKTDEDFPDWHQEISFGSNLEIPSQQVSKVDSSALSDKEVVQSETLISISQVDALRLSTQIYEAIKTAFTEPWLSRENEGGEKSIHESAKAFIDSLETDFLLVKERLERPLSYLSKSWKLKLHPTQVSSLLSGVFASNFAKVKSAIKQLEQNTSEILIYNFAEEDTALWEVAKDAGIGLLKGGVIGSVAGAYNSWQMKEQEEKEKQILLDKYQKSKGELIQRWTELFMLTYDSICYMIYDSHQIKLVDYASFKRVEELCERAIDYIENDNLKEALSTLGLAIELNPLWKSAWNFRGCALYNLCHYKDAIKDFNKAIEIDENFLLAWQNKGDSLQKLELDAEAIVAYNKVISLDSDNSAVWLSKSASLCNLKRYSEAIKASETAIAINPIDYEAWYAKATCAAKIQDSKQVLESLQKALSLNFKECRAQAKNNSSFDFIRDEEEFKALIEESSVGIDYSELKRLLAAKEWKKADLETAKVMWSAAHLAILALSEDERKEIFFDPDQVFTELDENIIKNFPCDDLNTIDKLWLKHSDGKFGFSIQKQIYQSLGGPQEFDWEIRDKFGNLTGWRVRDRSDKYYWRRFDQFEYDFGKAPRGHLPSCLWAAKEDGWFSTNRRDRLIALFARIDACSLTKLPKF